MAVARCWRRLLKLLGMPARDIQRAQVAAAGFAGSITASVRAASFSGPSTSTEVPFSLEQLTPDQQARLRAAFNRFDGDKSGQISAPEMLQVLRLLGSNPSQAEFKTILQAIDRNNDGVVDFLEFAQVWWEREQESIEDDFQEELQLAFKIFDADDSGFITAQELRDKLTTLGERMTDAEVDELLAECDKDGSGTISFAEFKDLPCWRS
ncbi:hypothetical protein AB1Y20_007869 [Prymnesium parvum]|uniref:EF-hand domain-containing protein n=1 Tax=Prymnesium parvum TaxID=97485 RepID=A0AB34IST3_PRYPA|mmetsp:Transcript_9182/g.22846  ORF Transcript_9182/g.22846 Transcript_9182/m.22846 type:complete len:209 (+) Transcript_9182:82-708(+)